MEISELIEIISRGEDGQNQFKVNFTNPISFAQELAAFSNANGGKILIGVSDDCKVKGLSAEDVHRLNGLISNAATDHIKPPISVQTENIQHPDGLVIVVKVLAGMAKPYMDKDGVIWVKNGADKRKATSREEIQRMFQSAALVHADETPGNGLSIKDLDMDYFKNFFEKEYAESLNEQDLPLERILENLNLCKDSVLNLAGALLFAKNPQFRLPAFIVKAICYPGSDIDDANYIDSRDLTGKIADIFQKSLNFILSNIKQIQGERTVNSTGESEIPRPALEELLANALLHRDYFITAPVRIFIFSDRIEIINPGHLTNNLTIENIKNGVSVIRNPVLTSFATRLLPYRGLGNGIRRALKIYPAIELVDEKDCNQFKCIIKRK